MKRKYALRVILVIFLVLCIVPRVRADGTVSVKILYDNYVAMEEISGDWGFSCLIEGTEKTILFDTGRQSDILLNNIRILHVDPQKIDVIVISHIHWDHTGGLYAVLEMIPNTPVYVPASFSDPFLDKMKALKALPIRVDDPVGICTGAHSTGEMGMGTKEQALVLDVADGIVIITGCAHPGIVDIVKKAKALRNRNIHMVMGGFHLLDTTEPQIRKIVEAFQALGVEKVGPTHCSGNEARRIFKEAYSDDFIELGAGKTVSFDF